VNYQRISKNEWQWIESNGKHRAVRYFEQQGTLIWSAWVDRPDGPQFENGISQPIADFVQGGAPPALIVPSAVIAELRVYLAPAPPERVKHRFLPWLRR
jgi:hypothetical protein